MTTEELRNAKTCIAGQTALKLEDSSALASFYGKQSVLLGTLHSPQQKLQMIRQVTREDIRRLARHLLHLQKLNIASIGPQSSLTAVKSHLTL